jgi:hypothetical protein
MINTDPSPTMLMLQPASRDNAVLEQLHEQNKKLKYIPTIEKEKAGGRTWRQKNERQMIAVGFQQGQQAEIDTTDSTNTEDPEPNAGPAQWATPRHPFARS